ncbi:hypothetical protein EYF80_000800 [Liparis tanakae]|uniref:Uncharacterized protein n=1 Tax=Liparis tanakae TaxID=230148 RepID=A0A4Z2JI29_9TELE|nr:hypothetical protein EYF80_000800 [Liparis tanakae]
MTQPINSSMNTQPDHGASLYRPTEGHNAICRPVQPHSRRPDPSELTYYNHKACKQLTLMSRQAKSYSVTPISKACQLKHKPPCDDDPFNSMNVLTSVNRSPANLLLVARKHHVTRQLALSKSKAAFSSLAAGKAPPLPPELNPLSGFRSGVVCSPIAYRLCSEASRCKLDICGKTLLSPSQWRQWGKTQEGSRYWRKAHRLTDRKERGKRGKGAVTLGVIGSLFVMPLLRKAKESSIPSLVPLSSIRNIWAVGGGPQPKALPRAQFCVMCKNNTETIPPPPTVPFSLRLCAQQI